jgi:tetratricopeptide (TPR) repeat protein
MRKKILIVISGLAVLLVAAVGLYSLPPIRSRLAPRLDLLRIGIIYAVHPPQDVVFVPTQQAMLTTVPTTTVQPASSPTPTTVPVDIATPTPSTTPLPSSNILSNVPYVDQCNRWNYCGPANLAMALKYWGWNGTRDDIAAAIKPGEDDPNLDFIQRGHSDVNVMPYEMVDYVNDNTSLKAYYAYGGDLTLLKRLISAGFPVITENGLVSRDSAGHTAWSGHFAFATGYDDATQTITWQDSYPNLCQGNTYQHGHNVPAKYSDYVGLWRDFDYVFIIIYPADKETEATAALGPWSDPNWAAQHALDMADQDIQTLSGDDLFFAYFNKGTSLAALFRYGEAAQAYDYAYLTLYPNLPEDKYRPYRIMWYQTGPYWAYFYTSRYQDVIKLADNNLTNQIFPPETLEESLYWRALAESQLGQYGTAIEDIKKAHYYNKNMQVVLQVMQEWGVSP